ncbi:hypothetical protein MAR_023094 [Mya arenaria]|uniref:Uncharacterized protein n=1 Tax=Mya arenaria TaxID=6604 RepID=A0ABY7DQ61_MYAAR|nr:hypothetical protein MAR_023094 [Mya arenaria]
MDVKKLMVNAIAVWTAGLDSFAVDDKEEQKFTISEVAVVAGGSLGGCLLLLGLVFACVLGYRRYMSASKTKDTTCVVPDRIYANTGRGYEGPYEMPLKNSNEHIYQTIQN